MFDASPKGKYIKDYISKVISQYHTPPTRNRHSSSQCGLAFASAIPIFERQKLSLRRIHTTVLHRAILAGGLEFILVVYTSTRPTPSYPRENLNIIITEDSDTRFWSRKCPQPQITTPPPLAFSRSLLDLLCPFLNLSG